jgi:sec-independent protein translocase protein TatC
MRKLLRSIWRIITAPFRLIARFFALVLRPIRGMYQRVYTFFTYEEEDTPLPDAFAKTIQNPQGIFYHLNALRIHLMRAVLVIILTTALSFTFIRPIMDILALPLEGGVDELVAVEVTENLGTVMRITLLSGFAIAIPYLVFEIYLFIAPGLHPRSRVKGLLTIPIAGFLFLSGMAFAYFIMLPVALPFLFNFMGLQTEARPSSYFNFVTNIMFWLGLTFEFPLVAYILADLGVMDYKQLASQWRIAFLIIAVLAAAITPTVDPVNMALVMGPMIVLYFLSIGLAYIATGGKTKQEASLDQV